MRLAHEESLRVVRYTPGLDGKWDRFVREESRNGCLFHERSFLSYHAPGRFKDASLLFVEGDRVVGVLPAAAAESPEGEGVVSHPGSSAGGLIFHKRSRLRDVLRMLEMGIADYARAGFISLELRLAESIFSPHSDGELSYLLWHRGFRVKTREFSSCIELSGKEHWRYFARKKNCNEVNSARRNGLTVERTDAVDRIHALIASNLKTRYQKAPTHSVEELLELKRRYPDRVDCWVARRGEEFLAAVVIFAVNTNTVHTFYITQDYQYAQLHPMPLLFHTMLSHYRDAGYQWFNFGISSRGELIKWGILEFKEAMGGRGNCRDVYLLDDLTGYRRYAATLPDTTPCQGGRPDEQPDHAEE